MGRTSTSSAPEGRREDGRRRAGRHLAGCWLLAAHFSSAQLLSRLWPWLLSYWVAWKRIALITSRVPRSLSWASTSRRRSPIQILRTGPRRSKPARNGGIRGVTGGGGSIARRSWCASQVGPGNMRRPPSLPPMNVKCTAQVCQAPALRLPCRPTHRPTPVCPAPLS